MKRGLAVSGICGAMCLLAGLALAADHTFDGTYTGKRVLTKGSASVDPTTPFTHVYPGHETASLAAWTVERLLNFRSPSNFSPAFQMRARLGFRLFRLRSSNNGLILCMVSGFVVKGAGNLGIVVGVTAKIESRAN